MRDLIWEAVGNRNGVNFSCEVRRTSNYIGLLTATLDSGRELLHEPVELSYGALFGADDGDVQEWQGKIFAALKRLGKAAH